MAKVGQAGPRQGLLTSSARLSPTQSARRATIAGGVLGTGVTSAVTVDVPEVPWTARLDELAAAHTRRHA
jgi:hypothetical protein